jgi:hypothetical protein
MKALFTGVYTAQWSYSGMLVAAQRMRRLGIDTWCLKISDGAHTWYGGLQSAIQLVKNIEGSVTAKGLKIIPYGYSYGNTYGMLSTEIAIAEAFLNAGLSYMFDCETEWNGQEQWMDELTSSLDYRPFYVTSWADPLLQNWQGLLQILEHNSDALIMPQVYTEYLQSVWIEQYNQCRVSLDRVIPVYSHQTLKYAVQYAASEKPYALWEYASLTDSEVTMVTTTGGNDYQLQAMRDCWNSSSAYLKTVPPFTTGIAQSWQEEYRRGILYGPPLSFEYDSVDWQGNKITVQEFARARAEYNPITHTTQWYR